MNHSKSKLPVAIPMSLLALGASDISADPVTDDLNRLQKEFEAELAVLKGRVDGLEARVGELEATQFSTTTKLRGSTTFFGGNFAGDGSNASTGLGNGLDFDTSFTGKDLLRTRLRAGYGYSDNPNEELWPNAYSGYYNFGAETHYKRSLGDLGHAYIGGGFNYYHFQEDIPTRWDGDQDIYDIDLNFGAYLTFSDSLQFTTKNQLTYGGIGGFGRTLRQGVLDEDLTTFLSENYLTYPLGGAVGTTGFRLKLFDESEYDDLDSEDYSFLQEFSFPRTGDQPTFYFNGVLGSRNYHNPWINLDSDYFQVNAGIRGKFPCGASYDLSGGYEWRDYDYENIEDQNNARFEASIFGSPRDGLNLAFIGRYGVHNIFPNYGGYMMADPLGCSFIFRAEQSLGDLGDLGFSLQRLNVTGLDSGSTMDFSRTGAQLYYNFPINDQIVITPNIGWTEIEGDTEDESFLSAGLQTTFKF